MCLVFYSTSDFVTALQQFYYFYTVLQSKHSRQASVDFRLYTTVTRVEVFYCHFYEEQCNLSSFGGTYIPM